MKAKYLARLGIPRAGGCMELALKSVGRAVSGGMETKQLAAVINELVTQPDAFRQDPNFGELAEALITVQLMAGMAGSGLVT